MHTFDQIDALIVELNSLKPINDDYLQRIVKKFRLEFNYNSNHIEGNTLTYGETELLLFFGDTTGNHNLREYEEMKAHDTAYHLIEEWAKDRERPLTEQSIKNLNEIILVRPFWKEAVTLDGQSTRRLIKVGDYKEYPNSVRLQNGEIFEYPSPIDTPILMNELLEWYRAEEAGLNPVTLAAMFHYKFVRIHPFDDGNGRIARLLMNYVFLRNELPPVVIKADDKTNYLRALHLADIGNYEPFIQYIAEQLIWSLSISVKAAKGESIEEPDDIDKRIKLLKTQLNKPDIVTQRKSLHSTNEALAKCIFPIFELLEDKLSPIKDLFLNAERTMQFQEGGKSYRLGNENSELSIYKNWIKSRTADNLENSDGITELIYTYQLKGFKKALKLQYVTIQLNIHFYEFDYTLRLNHNHQTEKRFGYDEILDKKVIFKIVNQLLVPAISQIEAASGLSDR